ncbi:MAG: N-formylglutamate amidohydrolase [Rhodocyclaceae bacterium]|nr:N-formylglutamate amidohydrolase [Rhodocyclaceae bacterium]MBX3669688.1 N-formylglutamate amidohydrolase [Rhodocyclaceae bacterium]
MSATTPLLSPTDPPPYTVFHPEGASPFIILADHGGRAIPAALGSLGLAAADLDRHICWDLGVAALAAALAGELDAFAIVQNYTRLVIDCNRQPGAPESIVTRSENTGIPGNFALDASDAVRREREIFQPYHARIAAELEARACAGRAAILVALHSFTPSYLGAARPWQIGVLYHKDARLARPVLDLLRRDATLAVGENQPYSADDGTDYAIIVHGEARGQMYVELEIRQDELADAAGVARWARRLAPLLVQAAASAGACCAG